jgi:hypothetical protein
MISVSRSNKATPRSEVARLTRWFDVEFTYESQSGVRGRKHRMEFKGRTLAWGNGAKEFLRALAAFESGFNFANQGWK